VLVVAKVSPFKCFGFLHLAKYIVSGNGCIKMKLLTTSLIHIYVFC
jgi:hypothetical protein